MNLSKTEFLALPLKFDVFTVFVSSSIYSKFIVLWNGVVEPNLVVDSCPFVKFNFHFCVTNENTWALFFVSSPLQSW
jgi:hypothetical protein